jgi:hypothetical protein
MEEQKRKRVDLVGPVLLIVVGIILLLNVLGILEWSIWWTLLRLWPIFLIALGLELLLGRWSLWGSILAMVLVLAIFAGALWLTRTDFLGTSGLTAKEIRQPLGDATEAAVVINPGFGILRIEALPESANLIEGEIHLLEGEEVVQEYSERDGQATFELRREGGGPGIPFGGGLDERQAWELGLSPGATLQLETSLVLGEAGLDLSDLALSGVETNMGIGVTRVTMPEEGRYQARIEGAIGVTTIVLPEGLAARLQLDTGIAARQLPDGYQEQGEGVYISPGYATATDRVDLDVSQAIGVLQIRHTK